MQRSIGIRLEMQILYLLSTTIALLPWEGLQGQREMLQPCIWHQHWPIIMGRPARAEGDVTTVYMAPTLPYYLGGTPPLGGTHLQLTCRATFK